MLPGELASCRRLGEWILLYPLDQGSLEKWGDAFLNPLKEQTVFGA